MSMAKTPMSPDAGLDSNTPIAAPSAPNLASASELQVDPVFHIPREQIKRSTPIEDHLPCYRTEFMRDRDRIMYATAFRRLAGKTQIYTVGSDDHKKNRLTHTLEVAQIARTISAALGFDADLAEAIALAHDFGHTPFGHAGEQMLHEILIPDSRYVKESPFYQKMYNDIRDVFEREALDKIECMDSLFGFKHNLHSIRVCTLLEDSYRGPKGENIGLNLTNFTLCGMMLHSNLTYKDTPFAPNFQKSFERNMGFQSREDKLAWSFESYIVKYADDIAQWHHDLEDAMREGVLPTDKICETVRSALDGILKDSDASLLNGITNNGNTDRSNLAKLSHVVVHTLVEDLIHTSSHNFKELKAALDRKHPSLSANRLFLEYDELELPLRKDNVIRFSLSEEKTKIFEETIREWVHHSQNVERMNEKGRYIIRKLFEAYYAHPQQLPDGPILHMMVTLDPVTYPTIDKAKSCGIGELRVQFDKKIRNPNIYTQVLLMRRICDHIASMTDHYAVEEYNKLYG